MSNDHTQPEPDHAASDQPMLAQGLKSLYDASASGVSETARARLDARVLDLAKGHFASVASAADPISSAHPMRLHPGPVAGSEAGRARRDLPIFVRYRWAISGAGLAAALVFAFVLSTQTNTPSQPQPATPTYGLTSSNETTDNSTADPRGPLPRTTATARTATGASPTIGASDIDAAGSNLAAKPGRAEASTNPAWYNDLLRKTETARAPDIVDAHRVALLASAAIVPTFARPEQVGEDVRAALSLGGAGALTFAEVDQLASRAVNLNLGASPGAGIDCPDFWALDIPSDGEFTPADEFVRPIVGEGRGTGS
ncbi:MAG: hypothetical protein IBJ18_03080 [Phycisphaerales bacterium]|nr:hypothetical protein [Phycisphaerales bacterium]